MDNNYSYKWKPIEDISSDYANYVDSELKNIASIWKEQRGKLANSQAVKQFNLQLQRRWAIETGLIENLYTLDRGITQTLVEHGINASLIPHGKTNKPIEYVVNIIQDQQNVIEGLFDFIVGTRNLTCSYIKEIHAALTAHQTDVDAVDSNGRYFKAELIRGNWKKLPNNPSRQDGTIHEYCPPEHVDSEMDRMIEMHNKHIVANVPPEVQSAWLHHRFTQIHPFQDGNGRVARSLATLVLLRAGWFPLVILSDEHRTRYINSLEKADYGDLSELVRLFSELEKNAFIRALSISDQVVAQQENFDAMLSGLAERFQQRNQSQEAKRREVLVVSDDLISIAHEKMTVIASQLQAKLSFVVDDFQSFCERSTQTSSPWFWKQVVKCATDMNYFANIREYHNWVRLKIREKRQIEIVISIHPVGVSFEGLMAAVAFFEYRDRQEDGQAEVDGPYMLTDKPFIFSYKEKSKNITCLFEKWVDDVILQGLAEWKRQV